MECVNQMPHLLAIKSATFTRQSTELDDDTVLRHAMAEKEVGSRSTYSLSSMHLYFMMWVIARLDVVYGVYVCALCVGDHDPIVWHSSHVHYYHPYDLH